MKTIRFTKAAVRSLRATPAAQAALVRAKIEQYTADPATLSNNVKRLKGRLGWRLRVGDYRVIFTDDGAVLDILSVGHRREVYE